MALASIRGTGDVCLREPSPDWPFNLCALFLGREPGSGCAAADQCARQWGRPLGRWTDLEIE
ncbi:hypothetical protein HZA57_07255 [Candidatus Poribacteria bacterium]|nr:hypothetical protein [Candidatus Poribacteria bacterium]